MYSTKIKSIKKVGEIQTYDLHTPKYHNFFLNNGILSHNSGKTWSAISYAVELDPKFDVDKQVVFDFRSCMNLINQDWFQVKKIKVILWDEPQITISNRAWQSQMNKLVNYLVSTFRHQNIVLIMAAPYKDFLDSQTMKLLLWEFQCVSIDRKKKQCIIYPKYQQYNPQKKKTYPHTLNVIMNNKKREMKVWKVKKPSKETIKIYEKNKTTFTSKLNENIQDTLDEMENISTKLLNSEVRSEYYTLWVKCNKDPKKVAEITGTTVRNVNKHIRKYLLNEIKQKELKKQGKSALITLKKGI